MDIQLTSLSQGCSDRKLFVNHSRLIHTAKSSLKKIKYFNALLDAKLLRHIYNPFPLRIIIGSQDSFPC